MSILSVSVVHHQSVSLFPSTDRSHPTPSQGIDYTQYSSSYHKYSFCLYSVYKKALIYSNISFLLYSNNFSILISSFKMSNMLLILISLLFCQHIFSTMISVSFVSLSLLMVKIQKYVYSLYVCYQNVSGSSLILIILFHYLNNCYMTIASYSL